MLTRVTLSGGTYKLSRSCLFSFSARTDILCALCQVCQHIFFLTNIAHCSSSLEAFVLDMSLNQYGKKNIYFWNQNESTLSKKAVFASLQDGEQNSSWMWQWLLKWESWDIDITHSVCGKYCGRRHTTPRWRVDILCKGDLTCEEWWQGVLGTVPPSTSLDSVFHNFEPYYRIPSVPKHSSACLPSTWNSSLLFARPHLQRSCLQDVSIELEGWGSFLSICTWWPIDCHHHYHCLSQRFACWVNFFKIQIITIIPLILFRIWNIIII